MDRINIACTIVTATLLSGCINSSSEEPDEKFLVCKPTVGAKAVTNKKSRPTTNGNYITNSRGIKTRDITANMSIRRFNEDEVKAYVYYLTKITDIGCFFDLNKIFAGGCWPENIELKEGDYVTVTTAGETHQMTSMNGGYGIYLPYSGEGVDYSISLYRTIQDNALNSRVTMPPEVTFDLPSSSVYRSDETIPVSWSPSGLIGYKFALSVDLLCPIRNSVETVTVNLDYITDDLGAITLDPTSLLREWSAESHRRIDEVSYCELQLNVSRESKGSVSGDFGWFSAGRIEAEQQMERRVCIDAEPYVTATYGKQEEPPPL